MNRPHGRLDFVGTAVVGTAACTRLSRYAQYVITKIFAPLEGRTYENDR